MEKYKSKIKEKNDFALAMSMSNKPVKTILTRETFSTETHELCDKIKLNFLIDGDEVWFLKFIVRVFH